MFIYKEGRDSFKRDTELRHVRGVSSGMFELTETDGPEVSRNHERNEYWYGVATLAFAVIMVAVNLSMLVWPPVYGMFQVLGVNTLLVALIFHNANLCAMSKQKIGYQSGRESLGNIKNHF